MVSTGFNRCQAHRTKCFTTAQVLWEGASGECIHGRASRTEVERSGSCDEFIPRVQVHSRWGQWRARVSAFPQVICLSVLTSQLSFVLNSLELYVAVAKARPKQVLAIAIRDVSTAIAKKVGTPSRKPTMSDVDFAALDEALGHVDGQDQAAKAGIGGRKRDAAKKLIHATSGLDLRRLRLSSPSTDSTSGSHDSPQRQDSVESMSSLSGTDQRASPSSSTGETSPPDIGNSRRPRITQETISTIGATGSSSDPGESLEEEAREVEEEFQELSATQTKLLRRAAEWNERVVRLSQELPAGVRLLLFREPREVEQTLLQLVRDSK